MGTDEADERLNTVIGEKWRLERVIGRGAMAVVYEARHRNGNRAALKVMHKELVGDEGAEERFFSEARLANSVSHPGIAKVLDDGHTADGCPYLVMELLEGMTLEQLRVARGGYVAPQEVMELAKRLLDVMVSMHETQIIHRDLKPTNVFLTNDGELKLLDFGLARSLLSGTRAKSSVVGFVMGTPSFMSPEQALGKRDEVDAVSDVWSLGAILFTLLTGQVVHQAPTPEARLMAAASQKARSIKTVMPTLDARIAGAIDRALQYEKKARFPTVRAMRDALFVTQQSIATAIAAAAPAPAKKPVPPPNRAMPAEVEGGTGVDIHAPPAFGHASEPPAFGHASEPPAFGTEGEDLSSPHALQLLDLGPVVEREDAAPPSVRHVSVQGGGSSQRLQVAPSTPYPQTQTQTQPQPQPRPQTPGPMQPQQPSSQPHVQAHHAQMQSQPQIQAHPQVSSQPQMPAHAQVSSQPQMPAHAQMSSQPQMPAHAQMASQPQIPARPPMISQPQLQTQPMLEPQAIEMDVPIDMDEPARPLGQIETRPMAAPTMLVRQKPPPRSSARIVLVAILAVFFVLGAAAAGFVYTRHIKLRR